MKVSNERKDQAQMRILMGRPLGRMAYMSAALCVTLLSGTMALGAVGASASTAKVTSASTPGVTSVTTSTVIDRTCQKRHEGITTCEWLLRSLFHSKLLPHGEDTQFETWASMDGGSVEREIVQVILEMKSCIVPACGIQVVGETGLDPASGHGNISAHLANRLCAEGPASEYRPIFQYRYWEPKPTNEWVSGWSYGDWQPTFNIKPCDDGVHLG